MDNTSTDKMIKTGGFIFAIGGLICCQLKKYKKPSSNCGNDQIDEMIREYEEKYNISIDMEHDFFKM